MTIPYNIKTIKNMKKLIFFFAVIFTTAMTALAQPSIGVRAGFDCSSLGVQKDDIYKWRAGFNVGVVADFTWKERLTFRPGAYFIKKGYDQDGAYGRQKHELNYLEVPLLLVLKEPIGEKTTLELQFGPYFAYGIGGKYEETWQGKELHTEKHDTFKDKRFSDRFDIGFTPGIGISSGRFYGGLSYDLGLLFHDNIKLNNHCIMANVGFRIM